MREYRGLELNLFTDDEIELIHLATMEVLEDTGIRVIGDEALEVFDGAGCRIDRKTSMVKIPQHLVEDAIRSAPSKVLLAARDPKKDVVLGGFNVNFAPFGLGIKVIDPVTGELRSSTVEDVENASRVVDALDEAPLGGGCVAALDVPESIRSLYQAEASFNNTSKPIGGGDDDPKNRRRIREMAGAVLGGMDKLKDRPIISMATCPNSPLELHRFNTEILIEGAKEGLPVYLLSMVMAGGTGPITMAGSLVVHNAEVLAGITLGQLVRRGSPIIYASDSSAFDLTHATLPVGSPEHALMNAAVAQIGRYYKIPTLVGGT